MTYKCPLGMLVPDRLDTEQIKLEGWRDHGILVVSVEDKRLSAFQRELVNQLGELLYGEKYYV